MSELNDSLREFGMAFRALMAPAADDDQAAFKFDELLRTGGNLLEAYVSYRRDRRSAPSSDGSAPVRGPGDGSQASPARALPPTFGDAQ